MSCGRGAVQEDWVFHVLGYISDNGVLEILAEKNKHLPLGSCLCAQNKACAKIRPPAGEVRGMAGWLWGRRKAGNDCGSCLPADDELQLLVGAFHQGDGLSPGAAQLHLVDVHHFITSLQLGRQGICLPSLFDLHRREGRSERCLTWFGFHLQS